MTSSSEPLVLTSEDQRILWVNQAACRSVRHRRTGDAGSVVEGPARAAAGGRGRGLPGGHHARVPQRRGGHRHRRKEDAPRLVFGLLRSARARCTWLLFIPPGERRFGTAYRPVTTPMPVSAEVTAAVGHEIRTPLATALVYMGIVQQAIDADLLRRPGKDRARRRPAGDLADRPAGDPGDRNAAAGHPGDAPQAGRPAARRVRDGAADRFGRAIAAGPRGQRPREPRRLVGRRGRRADRRQSALERPEVRRGAVHRGRGRPRRPAGAWSRSATTASASRPRNRRGSSIASRETRCPGCPEWAWVCGSSGRCPRPTAEVSRCAAAPARAPPSP